MTVWRKIPEITDKPCVDKFQCSASSPLDWVSIIRLMNDESNCVSRLHIPLLKGENKANIDRLCMSGFLSRAWCCKSTKMILSRGFSILFIPGDPQKKPRLGGMHNLTLFSGSAPRKSRLLDVPEKCPQGLQEASSPDTHPSRLILVQRNGGEH